MRDRRRPVPNPCPFQYAIASRVVLSKIRGRISPQLQYMNSGGAATSLPVLQFFEDIGVPITEVRGGWTDQLPARSRLPVHHHPYMYICTRCPLSYITPLPTCTGRRATG